eukprot:TRINITY_DN1928_c0_g1_i1.p2 TRINITY_DN1928_c0_g1~~TRINITY_DN1928_c0_g1_i1.p2  ORF type:complete len:232 (+),score=66.93 TRINITY_DN1928_c0_g1_i1:1315-2010(+)
MSGCVLIFGGTGQLGSVVVEKYVEAKWTVISVDLRKSDKTPHGIEIKGDGSKEDAELVVQKVKELNVQLDVVVSVAGGFLMGNIKDSAIFAQVERMFAFNVKSSVAAGHVAAQCLKEGGLLVLTGAHSALSPTPGLIAYGISKVATHHLVHSLAAPDSGLPKGTTVTAMLPVMLDTVQNRTDMPNANFDDWTPLEDVAQVLLRWSNGDQRPESGSLMQLNTKNKQTEFVKL